MGRFEQAAPTGRARDGEELRQRLDPRLCTILEIHQVLGFAIPHALLATPRFAPRRSDHDRARPPAPVARAKSGTQISPDR